MSGVGTARFSLASSLSLLALTALALTGAIAHGATLPTGFAETRIAAGIPSPTAMAFAPDGRLFIAQQNGQLRVIRNNQLLSTPFLTVGVNSAGERGLLGVAFDPNFASNGFVYVYYTTATSPIHNRLSRFTASAANPDVAAAGSEVQLLNLPNLSSATNHNGGAIHFGTDGRLYLAVGENANGANAPSFNTTLGKLLRMNPDGTAPPDNPHLGQTTGQNQLIWARGLRNPFNFAIDRTNGRIHVNDVGENSWEEVNLGVAGANYGWPSVEGPNPANVAGLRYPIHNYQNAGNFCAITGAAFYRPVTPTFPAEYAGRYFFGDFCGGFIRMLSPPNYDTATGFATGISQFVDIRVHTDGSLWYLARGNTGEVFRVQFTGAIAPTVSAHPSNVTVAAGQSASFTVAASGTTPLSYQWQRNGANITGANSPTFSLTATAGDNGAAFRAVVSNNFGSITSNAAVLMVLTNAPPTGTITSPANGTTYRGGQMFTFAATGTDPESGTLPASAFTWRVDFHHDDHIHPHVADTVGNSGTFTIADRGEVSDNVFHRVHLTVRDPAGLTHASFRDIQPLKSVIRLESNVAGAQLTLDGLPVTAPAQFTGVEGVFRTIGVVTPQTTGGVTYQFVSWSDGGAATHEVNTPTNDTTFTVLLQQATPAGATLTVTRAGTGAGTVTSNPAGINCGTICTANYAAGTSVTLTAAAAGSTFAGWGGACSGTASCVVSMTQARNVTATFNTTGSTTFALTVTRAGTGTGTVTSNTGGINCGTACSVNLASGTSVTLTAGAASGSTFAGWSGACTGTATACTVSMTQARAVTATFNASGGTGGTCANPITFSGNTGNFNTTSAVCYRTNANVNGWGCFNFDGRTVTVSGVARTCGQMPVTRAADGFYYFAVTAGAFPWAGLFTW